MAALPTRVRESADGFMKLIRSFDRKDWLEVLFLTAVTVCGVLARIELFPHESNDMTQFLLPWYEYLHDNGGFRAVGDEIGDYPPMYYYFLAALTYTNIPPMTGIKVFSCIFDVITAFYVKSILDINYRKTIRPIIGYAAAFMLPEVVLNSASWGQCDGIFSCFVVITLYYFLKGKDIRAMIFYGIAVSFKLQAVFLMPFIIMMVIRKKIRIRSLCLIPAVFVLSVLPAAIAGGDLHRLLTIYTDQMGEYSALNMSSPNIWTILDGVDPEMINSAGVYFAGGIVMILMYICLFQDPHPEQLTVRGAIIMAALSCFTVPLLLPHMHERYFYCADLMILLASLCFAKRFWMLIAAQFSSVGAMCSYLFGKGALDMRILLMFELLVFVALIFCLRDEFRKPRGREVVMHFEAKPEGKTEEAAAAEETAEPEEAPAAVTE